nr:Soluble aldose sugar dehydrogenase yliI precursor [Klebsiella pneumoniae]
MARAAEMKLIFRRRGKITAGRWRRTVLTTAACPFRKQKAKRFRGPNLPVCLVGLSRVSGMAFYSAPTFPQWQHKLFIGALKETSLIVPAVDGNQVREEEITGGARKTHPRCSRGTRRLSVRFNRRV